MHFVILKLNNTKVCSEDVCEHQPCNREEEGSNAVGTRGSRGAFGEARISPSLSH